jgi:mannosyltransferase
MAFAAGAARNEDAPVRTLEQDVGAPADEPPLPVDHDDLDPALARWLVAGCTVVLTGLVLWRLGDKSFWQDEAYTWSTVQRDWGAFVTLVREAESQNLLYSLFMWVWVRIGDTEGFLRLPSAVCVIAAVPAMYLAGRALATRTAGVVAALLFAINANATEFGQEARAYALMMLLAALSIAGFAETVRRPTRRSYLLWVVPSALISYAHPYAIFVVVAELTTLVWYRKVGPIPPAIKRGTVVIGVTAMPMFLLLATQGESRSLLGLPPWYDAVRYVTGLVGKGSLRLIALWGAVGLFGLWRVTRRWRTASPFERWQLAAPWTLMIVTLGVCVASGIALQVFTPRHVLPALPAVVLTVAISLCEITSRKLFVAVLAVMVAMGLTGVWKWYYGRPKQNWREATAYVLEEAAPGDLVVFVDDQARIDFEYYARDDEAQRDALVPAFPDAPWDAWGTGDQKLEVPSAREIRAMDGAEGEIWVVLGGSARTEKRLRHRDLKSVREKFDDGLDEHARRSERKFHDSVSVFRYPRLERTGSSTES